MDRLIHPSLSGRATAWFSPTYKMLGDAWRSLTNTLHPITAKKSDSDHRLVLRGGGVVEMWSLDNPDSGRGRAYSAVVIDEAALVVDLDHAWQQSIRPMLTDHKGSAWFLSTPKGTSNYFHTLYQKGHGLLRGEWRSWLMPTSANPYIDKDEIESAREDLSDLAFSQEYGAMFVSWEGSVFRKILDAISLTPATGKAAVIGCDWGRVNDFTCFVVLSDNGEVLTLDRFRGVEYSLQRARLQALYERYGKPVIYAESNSMGTPVIEQLQRDGLRVKPFVTTNASKSEAVEALALAFERNEIRIPNDPVLLGELQSFEAKALPSGLICYSAPEGAHDDTVMALAIAWQGVAGHARTQTHADFVRATMDANASLTKSAMGGNSDATPSDYPEGGAGSVFASNPWNSKRWSM